MTERKKSPGRPKGAQSMSNRNIYSILNLRISERLPYLFKWIDEIEDPAQRVNAMAKIMEFRYPKQKSVEFSLDEGTSSSLEDKLNKMISK